MKDKILVVFVVIGALISACGSSDEKGIADGRKLAINDFNNREIKFYSIQDSLIQREQYIKNYFNNLNINVVFVSVDYCGNASDRDIQYIEQKASSYDSTMDSILCNKYGKGIHQKIQQYCDSAFLFDKQNNGNE